MPVAVKRNVVSCTDINEKEYQLPCYYVFVFRKEIPIILFYLSKGIDYALDYLHVSEVVEFIEKLPSKLDDSRLYFPLSGKCILSVDKEMFDEFPYVQSIVGAFETVCTNRTSIASLDNKREWIKKIANPPVYEKGYGILKYFNRLLDRLNCSIKTSLIAKNSLEPLVLI